MTHDVRLIGTARAPVWRRRWREHPLRRPVDVAEAWLLLVLGAVLWSGALLAGVAAGGWAYGRTAAAAAEQAATRHQVTAEIVQDVSGAGPATTDGRTQAQKVRADVRWTGPDGRVGTGVASVPADAARGDRTAVWLDADGRVTEPPMSGGDVWSGAVVVGATVTALGVSAAAVAGAAVRGAARRYRAAEWEHEWRRVEPQWTRRGV
ncbi:hypothetical protein [Streptomyces sp. TRM49041]|uniref:Rv1733c family protein n=1 Tax=Streptomyces sp. TRM49041 TaxID=2603216 RepID=UPI0011ED4C36|nr:hypothetical protein [Streptomyces sp. TRM49041]